MPTSSNASTGGSDAEPSASGPSAPVPEGVRGAALAPPRAQAGSAATARDAVAFRAPTATDARAIHALVRASGVLDVNSPYAYLLLCTDFADTGVVAQRGGALAGFVLGYRPPARPEAVFVWQVGVDAAERGRGLAGRLLRALMAGPGARGARFLEATVTPSNAASAALFRAFGRRVGAPCREAPAFAASLFPGPDHEEEIRFRIGPLEDASHHPFAPLED